jgi:15-hydroxyprostaglandin dehydrogenase (NAD)
MGRKCQVLPSNERKIRTSRFRYSPAIPSSRPVANFQVAANAGIDDTQDLYIPSDGVTKPNLKTIEVDLFGPIYASYLALHYFRTNEPNTGGKVVITSSTAGLYGCPPQPQYGTAKFGCIGLARSMGEFSNLQAENITVNAICPSFVPTGLAPPEMLKSNTSLKRL